MKSLFIIFISFSFLGIPAYVSADEFFSSLFENSTFEKSKRENKIDLSFANLYSNTSRLHFTSLQTFSAGGIYDGATSTSVTSDRMFGARKYLEITPMWGYTFGGEFEDEENDETIDISEESSIGFRLAYDYGLYSQIEFIYSHQETELTGGDSFPRDALFGLDIHYFHIGGTLFWGRDKWQPYFTGTVGLTHFNPEDSGIDSLTRFSMGFGGGVRYFPTERVGLYLGARALVTFVNSEIEAYSSSEGSYVIIESDVLWQFQVYAGLIFTF
jgi:opacity protein-like surface antigen